MFVNDIFKKKQLNEGGFDIPEIPRAPQPKPAPNKDKTVDEAGPFTYGAKKPRKGSVADLAAQKRKEQERGRQPVEPRDQMAGTAKVTKDVAEGRGNIESLRTELMGEYLNIYYNALDGHNMTDHIINLQDVYGRVKRSRDPVLQQTYNLLMDHAEESIDVQASAALKAIRILGDEPNYTPPPRPPMSPEDSARADAFVNQFLAALVSNGIKTHPDWQKNNDKGVAEGTQVLKLNDYDQWSNKVDAQGAVKHVQKNRTFVVAQSWNGETIGEFDTRSNQGWVMSHSEQNLAEDAASKIVSKMIPGGASVFNAADAVRRYRSGDKVGAAIAAGGVVPITAIPAAAADLARDKYYTGSWLPSDEQRDLANLNRQVADMDKKNWTKLPDGSERSPDGQTIRGTVTKLSAEPQSKPVPGSMKPDSAELPSKSYPDDAQSVKEGSDNIEQIKAKIQELEAEQEENEYGSFAYDSVDAELQFLYGKLDKIKKQGLAEGSAQEKLYKRHQELRKKSGLPDPDYYKELKASYDLPDEQRYAKQKEIKQKYKVTNEEVPAPNVVQRADQTNTDDLDQLSKQMRATVPKTRVDTTKWTDEQRFLQDKKVGKFLGSSFDEWKQQQNRTTQSAMPTNEDREKYIEELQRAGYEIVTERRMTCPECGGAAYEDQMLAEKQDACYHKVKSRYKVWPSAYASGALVRCRKKGAKNWGNKSKK